jgi:hypothetical protein
MLTPSQEAMALTKPTQQSPANNAVITSASATFSWTHPYKDKYEVKIKTGSGTLKYASGKSSSKSKAVNLSRIPLAYGSTYKWYVVIYANGKEDSSADRYFTYKFDGDKPVFNSFTAPSSIYAGGSVSINYSISDSGGSGLKQVELWRANDSGGSPSGWTQIATRAISGDSSTGSFSDNRSSTGKYWYGMHVVDNAGNWIPEPSPIKVTVAVDDHANNCTSATTVALNSTRAGNIEVGGDYDYFKIQVPSPGTLTVSTTGSTDTYIFLKNASCADIASNNNYPDKNSSIPKLEQTGTYYVAVRHYNSSAGTGFYVFNVSFTEAKEGWSDVTGYQHAETTKQKAIVAAALNGGNRPSPQSVATGSNVVWRTDTDDGDGARMRSAIQDVYNYWVGSGRPTLPLQSIPTNVQNTIRSRLSEKYSAVLQKFIEQIRLVFNGTVPISDNQTLTYLGIRAQCKEFADRMVQAGGGVTHNYGFTEVKRTNIRPGMYALKNGNKHAAIIVAVNWDASGQPTQLRLAESNWCGTTGFPACAWDNPKGQVPWDRIITTTRQVPIADYYVVATE